MTLKDDIETVDATMELAGKHMAVTYNDIEAYRHIVSALHEARASLRWMVKDMQQRFSEDDTAGDFGQAYSPELSRAIDLLERLEEL